MVHANTQTIKNVYKESSWQEKMPIRCIILNEKCRVCIIYAEDVNDSIYMHICNDTHTFTIKMGNLYAKVYTVDISGW